MCICSLFGRFFAFASLAILAAFSLTGPPAFSAENPEILHFTESIAVGLNSADHDPAMLVVASVSAMQQAGATGVVLPARSCQPFGGAFLVPVTSTASPGVRAFSSNPRALAVPWCRPAR